MIFNNNIIPNLPLVMIVIREVESAKPDPAEHIAGHKRGKPLTFPWV